MVNLTETGFSEINDDYMINNICNEYYYQLMLKTKNIHLSKTRNFYKLKDKKPEDWKNFEKFHKICIDNKLDYKKYINFCLDEIIKIHKFIHVKYILNMKYIRMYAEEGEIQQQYNKINVYILNSVKKIIEICQEKKLSSFTEFLKYIIKEQKLGQYMKCGVISKYILALIPNIEEIKRFFDDESKHELDIYVINKLDKLNDDAVTALKKYSNAEYIDIIKTINTHLKQ